MGRPQPTGRPTPTTRTNRNPTPTNPLETNPPKRGTTVLTPDDKNGDPDMTKVGDVYVSCSMKKTKYWREEMTVNGFLWFHAVRIDVLDGDTFIDNRAHIGLVSDLTRWGVTRYEPIKYAQQEIKHGETRWCAPANTLALSSFMRTLGESFDNSRWAKAAQEAVDMGVEPTSIEAEALARGMRELERERKMEEEYRLLILRKYASRR